MFLPSSESSFGGMAFKVPYMPNFLKEEE